MRSRSARLARSVSSCVGAAIGVVEEHSGHPAARALPHVLDAGHDAHGPALGRLVSHLGASAITTAAACVKLQCRPPSRRHRAERGSARGLTWSRPASRAARAGDHHGDIRTKPSSRTRSGSKSARRPRPSGASASRNRWNWAWRTPFRPPIRSVSSNRPPTACARRTSIRQKYLAKSVITPGFAAVDGVHHGAE